MYVSITNIRNKSEIQKQNRIELKISQKKESPEALPQQLNLRDGEVMEALSTSQI